MRSAQHALMNNLQEVTTAVAARHSRPGNSAPMSRFTGDLTSVTRVESPPLSCFSPVVFVHCCASHQYDARFVMPTLLLFQSTDANCSLSLSFLRLPLLLPPSSDQSAGAPTAVDQEHIRYDRRKQGTNDRKTNFDITKFMPRLARCQFTDDSTPLV